MRAGLFIILAGILCTGAGSPARAQPDPIVYNGRWKNGIPSDTAFFPIAVWLQSPANAAKYKQAGVNLYIGLWEGPTQAQLSALATAGMRVICDQNAVGLQNAASKTIVGWMHNDEPDNAQAKADGSGYDPCIAPSQIVSGYESMRAKDSTRPVYLNLGRGVAVTDWIGRGTCTGKTDMYAQYAQGADILSFDVYPVNSGESKVRGNLWYVSKGVDSLARWSDRAKPVWTWFETTRIAETPADKPTPAQVRSEVWMAIIHGATGIGYFCHSFFPATVEAGFFGDNAMLTGITALNLQIQSLAPVLNSPTASEAATVASISSVAPINILVKRHGGYTYVFAAAMRPGQVTATFTVPEGVEAVVLGEDRSIPLAGGKFSDTFSDYGVHLYRIAGSRTGLAFRNRNLEQSGGAYFFNGMERPHFAGMILIPETAGSGLAAPWILDAGGRFRGPWTPAARDGARR
ncbi:MAG: putative glycosyl hydrolase [Fibrobacteres bacterium]|nr:putative glycosyl hydrolase [Fibrobacterota bacterium]